jgi:hypothetical protein
VKQLPGPRCRVLPPGPQRREDQSARGLRRAHYYELATAIGFLTQRRWKWKPTARLCRVLGTPFCCRILEDAGVEGPASFDQVWPHNMTANQQADEVVRLTEHFRKNMHLRKKTRTSCSDDPPLLIHQSPLQSSLTLTGGGGQIPSSRGKNNTKLFIYFLFD